MGTDIVLMHLKSVTERQIAAMELTVRKKSHVEGLVLHFSDPGNLVYRTKISLTLHGQI